MVKAIPQITQAVNIKGHTFTFEVDTGAGDNFCSTHIWNQLGKPSLSTTKSRYESATGDSLPVTGTFTVTAKLPNQSSDSEATLQFTVIQNDTLDILGRDAILKLGIDVNALITSSAASTNTVKAVFNKLQPDNKLQESCRKLCETFPELFKLELVCLKDFELDVRFKEDAKPIFCKPRPVPFAIQEDLVQSYDARIKRGVWEPTNFNAYGTPVVPIRKALLPGQKKAKLRVCGDYSATVNPQLEDHRQPVPLLEDLMRKLGGGYSFMKLDLADAYNQTRPCSHQKVKRNWHLVHTVVYSYNVIYRLVSNLHQAISNTKWNNSQKT